MQLKLGLFKSIEKIDAAIILAIGEKKRNKSEYNVEWEERIAKNLKKYVLGICAAAADDDGCRCLLACLMFVGTRKNTCAERRQRLFIHAQPC